MIKQNSLVNKNFSVSNLLFLVLFEVDEHSPEVAHLFADRTQFFGNFFLKVLKIIDVLFKQAHILFEELFDACNEQHCFVFSWSVGPIARDLLAVYVCHLLLNLTKI